MSGKDNLTPEQREEFANLLAGKEIKPETKIEYEGDVSVGETGQLTPTDTPGMRTWVDYIGEKSEPGVQQAEPTSILAYTHARMAGDSTPPEPSNPDKIAKADANLSEAGKEALVAANDNEYEPSTEDLLDYNEYLDEQDAIYQPQMEESPHLFEHGEEVVIQEQYSDAAKQMFEEYAEKGRDTLAQEQDKEMER